ncbi:MAG: Do family serine endopeptidase [Bacteroidia bacterium]
MRKYLLMFMVAGLGGLVALGINRLFVKNDSSGFNEIRLARFASLTDMGSRPDFVEVAELVTPTVVFIKTTIEPKSNPEAEAGQKQADPFEFFRGQGFGFPQMPQGPQYAQGSGVIISQDGYIVTNNHVVDGATKIKVMLSDKREYDADLIGKDKNTDLALIRIDEKNLPFAVVGNSDDVKVGQWALAVGNPFGLTSTVTAGIISAKGRSVGIVGRDPHTGARAQNAYPIESFIQTDAAVNPGNSGGALVSADGKLIGINTAIESQTGQYAGYAFAIPSNLMKKVVDDLTKYGVVQRGVLGVEIRDVTSELAEKENLKDVKGVYVNKVSPGSSAEAAGVKEKDVIVSVDGSKVNSSAELQELIGKHNPGDKVKLDIIRDGKERMVEAVLKNLDGKAEITKVEKTESNKVLDCELESINREERMKLKIQNGVRVKKIGGKSALKKALVPEGFILTTIDKKPVNSVSEVKSIMESEKGGVLLGGINPDGSKGFYGVGIDAHP